MQFIYTFLANPMVKRILSLSIIVISVIALVALLKNQGQELYYQHNPDALMQEMPFYALIKEHEPELYSRIEEDVRLALKEEQTPHELKMKVKIYLDTLIASRVPLSTNEAVVAYTRVTLDEMRALKAHGYGLCHRFLYPSSAPLELENYLTEDLLAQDMEALTSVIKDSYENTQMQPQVKDVQLYLSHVMTKMQETYSQEELQVLSNPLGIMTDKDKVCDITIALFEEILKLPEKQSGETLRYIVSQN